MLRTLPRALPRTLPRAIFLLPPRHYSTPHSTPPRSTLVSKLKRATSFTASSSLILSSLALSSLVLYLITSELLTPQSDTTLFNRAVSLASNDPVVQSWLGPGSTLVAFGQLNNNDKWSRNRPIVSNKSVDPQGLTHVSFNFHLQNNNKERGVVHVVAKYHSQWEKPGFAMMWIDVRGKGRHYIIKPKLNPSSSPQNNNKQNSSLFKWLGLTK